MQEKYINKFIHNKQPKYNKAIIYKMMDKNWMDFEILKCIPTNLRAAQLPSAKLQARLLDINDGLFPWLTTKKWADQFWREIGIFFHSNLCIIIYNRINPISLTHSRTKNLQTLWHFKIINPPPSTQPLVAPCNGLPSISVHGDCHKFYGIG